MWKNFTDFLETLVRDYGLVRISSALVVMSGLLAAAGVITSKSGLAVTFACILGALLLATVIAQYIDRVKLYKEKALAAEVLDRYALLLKSQQTPESFITQSWEEEQVCRLNGDTLIERWLTLRVGAEPLQTFWHLCFPDIREMSRPERSRVRVDAAYFTVGQGGTRLVGVALPVTTTWEDGTNLRLFIHFDEAQAPGSDVGIYLRIFWPKYSADFVKDGQRARVEWRFRRQTDSVSFRLRFPTKSTKGRSLVTNSHAGSPAVRVDVEGNKTVLAFGMQSPPPNQAIGFRHQLRPDGDGLA